MKKAMFDFRLYLQGLKRLRVLGIALAILCISISVLVPLSTWIAQASIAEAMPTVGYGEMVDPLPDITSSLYSLVEEVENRQLCVPVLVASYFAPVLILLMFSYLNKRNESDFYHAIPYTRGCVYTSFVAAALTWMWGTLIAGGLAAGLLWTLCPYTTYSFGGLICEILLACLNAAFLASFTAAAVSLTGTLSTSLVATALAMCSWRLVLGIAYITLEEMMNIVDPEQILGGYLTPQWVLPVALTGKDETLGIIVYAMVITLVMFALGGLLYRIRRSETAGRAVPGKALQIVFRCLITLPVALLLTCFVLSADGDITVLLILLVAMLLVFYLYELLTSKSVRSMLKATPWLGAVLAACLIFTGALYLSKYVILNETIGEDRIESIGLEGHPQRLESMSVSDYELYLMTENMSDDPELIRLIACALAESQAADRNNDFYDNSVVYTEGGAFALSKTEQYVRFSVRIKLKSGRTIGRYIRMPDENYQTLILTLRDDLKLNALPEVEDVDYFQVHAFDYLYSASPDEVWSERILDAMRQDHAAMSETQKQEMVNGSDTGIQFTLRIKAGEGRFFCNYYLNDAMPNTYAIVCELIAQQQQEVHEMLQIILQEVPEGLDKKTSYMTVALKKDMATDATIYSMDGIAHALIALLSEYADNRPAAGEESECAMIWISAAYDDPRGVSVGFDFPVPLLLDLTDEEYQTLIAILTTEQK